MANDQLDLPETARLFVAYPSTPSALGQTIEAAAEVLREEGYANVETWRQMDIPGRFILDKVLAHIDKADAVVADITRLNFNVTFEIGYAIGSGKRVILTSNRSLAPQTREISELGIFDTLGWVGYENASELQRILRAPDDYSPAMKPDDFEINRSAPLFLLDTLHKRDATVRTVARIRRARLRFRSFDPGEQPRMSANEAFRSVATSAGVVAHLLSEESSDQLMNNMRAAFVGGLAYGMEKELLLIQEGGSPVPLDYRDLVSSYQKVGEIDEFINGFAPRVTEALQKTSMGPSVAAQGLLAQLDFGAPAAENEVAQLGEYYMETAEYNQVMSGNVRLVVGRKGTGKSALFFQSRQALRDQENTVVCDLKPDGYQFKRFKEVVLEYVGEAAAEHIATSFWEYVLLLETSRNLLELDRKLHLRNHHLFDPYRSLDTLSSEHSSGEEDDFSTRLHALVERLADGIGAGAENGQGPLNQDLVTEYLYTHDIRELRSAVIEYLRCRQSGLWVLVDNIDKGWPTRGVEVQDVVIVRGLLEASRKLERASSKQDVELNTIVFLRNDVHEILIDQTPDHGKESRVSLDWTDPDLLKELVRKRLVFAADDLSEHDFDAVWTHVCDSHVHGEATADLLIDHSLMRPRSLINLLVHARGIASNLGHKKISGDDVEKAVNAYSTDLSSELGLEIRDVFPQGEEVLYEFLGAPKVMSLADIYARLKKSRIDEQEHNRCIELLLWFCFLGVVDSVSPESEGAEPSARYAYSVQYDMKKLLRLAGSLGNPNTRFQIHRAFWSFLDVV